MAIGKTAPNGTLNADGAFYSVQDVNVLLENAGGGGGGGADLPTPTVADAGSVVVVDKEGKYALGEAGGGENSLHVVMTTNENHTATLDKTYNEIIAALEGSKYIYLTEDTESEGTTIQYVHPLSGIATNGTDYYSAAFKDYTFESDSADGVLYTLIMSPGN